MSLDVFVSFPSVVLEGKQVSAENRFPCKCKDNCC